MITVCPVNAQESLLDVMDGGHGIYTAVCMVYVCIGFQGRVLHLHLHTLCRICSILNTVNKIRRVIKIPCCFKFCLKIFGQWRLGG